MFRHTHTHTLVLAGLAALATFGLSACGATDGSAHAVAPAASTVSDTGTATPSVTPSATPAPVPAAPAPAAPAPARGGSTGGGGTGSGGGGTSNGGGSGSGGGNSGGGGGGSSAPAPRITKFVISKQPSCPVSASSNPGGFSSPGNDVEISWSVTGASGAAIAVDDPGTYGAYGSDYPASGKLTLPFGCNDGTTTTHTYTVWPAGAHSVSKTISASAHSDN